MAELTLRVVSTDDGCTWKEQVQSVLNLQSLVLLKEAVAQEFLGVDSLDWRVVSEQRSDAPPPAGAEGQAPSGVQVTRELRQTELQLQALPSDCACPFWHPAVKQAQQRGIDVHALLHKPPASLALKSDTDLLHACKPLRASPEELTRLALTRSAQKTRASETTEAGLQHALRVEGIHGLWELASRPHCAAAFDAGAVGAVVEVLSQRELCLETQLPAVYAAGHLVTYARRRARLIQAGLVEALLDLLIRLQSAAEHLSRCRRTVKLLTSGALEVLGIVSVDAEARQRLLTSASSLQLLLQLAVTPEAALEPLDATVATAAATDGCDSAVAQGAGVDEGTGAAAQADGAAGATPGATASEAAAAGMANSSTEPGKSVQWADQSSAPAVAAAVAATAEPVSAGEDAAHGDSAAEVAADALIATPADVGDRLLELECASVQQVSAQLLCSLAVRDRTARKQLLAAEGAWHLLQLLESSAPELQLCVASILSAYAREVVGPEERSDTWHAGLDMLREVKPQQLLPLLRRLMTLLEAHLPAARAADAFVSAADGEPTPDDSGADAAAGSRPGSRGSCSHGYSAQSTVVATERTDDFYGSSRHASAVEAASRSASAAPPPAGTPTIEGDDSGGSSSAAASTSSDDDGMPELLVDYVSLALWAVAVTLSNAGYPGVNGRGAAAATSADGGLQSPSLQPPYLRQGVLHDIARLAKLSARCVAGADAITTRATAGAGAVSYGSRAAAADGTANTEGTSDVTPAEAATAAPAGFALYCVCGALACLCSADGALEAAIADVRLTAVMQRGFGEEDDATGGNGSSAAASAATATPFSRARSQNVRSLHGNASIELGQLQQSRSRLLCMSFKARMQEEEAMAAAVAAAEAAAAREQALAAARNAAAAEAAAFVTELRSSLRRLQHVLQLSSSTEQVIHAKILTVASITALAACEGEALQPPAAPDDAAAAGVHPQPTSSGSRATTADMGLPGVLKGSVRQMLHDVCLLQPLLNSLPGSKDFDDSCSKAEPGTAADGATTPALSIAYTHAVACCSMCMAAMTTPLPEDSLTAMLDFMQSAAATAAVPEAADAGSSSRADSKELQRQQQALHQQLALYNMLALWALCSNGQHRVTVLRHGAWAAVIGSWTRAALNKLRRQQRASILAADGTFGGMRLNFLGAVHAVSAGVALSQHHPAAPPPGGQPHHQQQQQQQQLHSQPPRTQDDAPRSSAAEVAAGSASTDEQPQKRLGFRPAALRIESSGKAAFHGGAPHCYSPGAVTSFFTPSTPSNRASDAQRMVKFGLMSAWYLIREHVIKQLEDWAQLDDIRGVYKHCTSPAGWWGLQLPAHSHLQLSEQVDQALELLVGVMGLPEHAPAAASPLRELAARCCWSLSFMHQTLSSRLVELGAGHVAKHVCETPAASSQLQQLAAPYLLQLCQLPKQLERLGGAMALCNTFKALLVKALKRATAKGTGVDVALLEHAARGLVHMSTLPDGKRALVASKSIKVLIQVLRTEGHAYRTLAENPQGFTATAAAGSCAGADPLKTPLRVVNHYHPPPEMDSPGEGAGQHAEARRRASVGGAGVEDGAAAAAVAPVVEDGDSGTLALWALLNVASHPPAQLAICKRGLYLLLKLVRSCPDPTRVMIASAVLSATSAHPDNASAVYRAELRMKYEQLAHLVEHEVLERAAGKQGATPAAAAPGGAAGGKPPALCRVQSYDPRAAFLRWNMDPAEHLQGAPTPGRKYALPHDVRRVTEGLKAGLEGVTTAELFELASSDPEEMEYLKRLQRHAALDKMLEERQVRGDVMRRTLNKSLQEGKASLWQQHVPASAVAAQPSGCSAARLGEDAGAVAADYRGCLGSKGVTLWPSTAPATPAPRNGLLSATGEAARSVAGGGSSSSPGAAGMPRLKPRLAVQTDSATMGGDSGGLVCYSPGKKSVRFRTSGNHVSSPAAMSPNPGNRSSRSASPTRPASCTVTTPNRPGSAIGLAGNRQNSLATATRPASATVGDRSKAVANGRRPASAAPHVNGRSRAGKAVAERNKAVAERGTADAWNPPLLAFVQQEQKEGVRQPDACKALMSAVVPSDILTELADVAHTVMHGSGDAITALSPRARRAGPVPHVELDGSQEAHPNHMAHDDVQLSKPDTGYEHAHRGVAYNPGSPRRHVVSPTPSRPASAHHMRCSSRPCSAPRATRLVAHATAGDNATPAAVATAAAAKRPGSAVAGARTSRPGSAVGSARATNGVDTSVPRPVTVLSATPDHLQNLKHAAELARRAPTPAVNGRLLDDAATAPAAAAPIVRTAVFRSVATKASCGDKLVDKLAALAAQKEADAEEQRLLDSLGAPPPEEQVAHIELPEQPVSVRMAHASEPEQAYSFDRIFATGDAAHAMYAFEHVDGCKVCESLYGHYLLPNGKLAHFYCPGAAQLKGHKVTLLQPPQLPWSHDDPCFAGLPRTALVKEYMLPGKPAHLFHKIWYPVPTMPPAPNTSRLTWQRDADGEASGAPPGLCDQILNLKVTVQELEKTETQLLPPEPPAALKSLKRAKSTGTKAAAGTGSKGTKGSSKGSTKNTK